MTIREGERGGEGRLGERRMDGMIRSMVIVNNA